MWLIWTIHESEGELTLLAESLLYHSWHWERFSPDESKLAELIVTHVIGTTPMLLTMKLKPVD